MTLPDIARAVATSRRTLERSFVAATGLTAGAWRRRSRILGSLEYLAAGMPVSHTAVAVGYTTPSAFVTAFKNDWAGRPASSSDADLHLTTNTKRRGRG